MKIALRIFNITFVLILIMSDLLLNEYTNIIFPILMLLYILFYEWYDTVIEKDSNRVRRIVNVIFIISIFFGNFFLSNVYRVFNLTIFVVYILIIMLIEKKRYNSNGSG